MAVGVPDHGRSAPNKPWFAARPTATQTHGERIRVGLERRMQYKVILESSDEGFSASVPGLPGCHSQGATEQEALENIADAIREYLEVAADLARRGTGREVVIEV